MNTYEIYVRAADRLCEEKPAMADAVRFLERLSRLYNKVRRSSLTVYQKEYLLRQLDHTRATVVDLSGSERKRNKPNNNNELLAA